MDRPRSRGKHDQAAALLHHERCGVVRGDIAAPEADLEHIDDLERLLPKLPGRRELVMEGAGIIDENVDSALLIAHRLKEGPYLTIVRVIDPNGDSSPARGGDGQGRFINGSR